VPAAVANALVVYAAFVDARSLRKHLRHRTAILVIQGGVSRSTEDCRLSQAATSTLGDLGIVVVEEGHSER
jgi:hypothetical protein